MKKLQTRRLLSMLLALCLVLALLPAAVAETINGQKIIYGYSGEGQELCAYRYGNGENVLIVGFALHGFEDHFTRDGQALVYTAEQLMASLSESGLAQQRGWSVYVLPCMNPDGLYKGYSHNGPGRCTTTRFVNGQLVKDGKGIDLNRCFPTNFKAQDNERNYTGPNPMAAKEAQALSNFLQKVKGSGTNLLIDTHGWYQQTIVFSKSSILYSAFHTYFPNNTDTITSKPQGYLIAYSQSLGYDSCLFEMPRDIYSMQGYYNSGYCRKYINSIELILKSKASVCASGHSYETTRVEPTCTKAGQEKKVCTRCGDTQTKTLAALGHTPDGKGNVVVREATATQNGLSAYTCKNCGASIETTVPKVFKDTQDTQYYCDAVDYAYANGLVKGMTDDTFGPNISLSRGMLVTILYRYAGSPEVTTTIPFKDVSMSQYYGKPVAWAYETGVVNGISETEFRPNDSVTRQQAAAILFRYVTMLGKDNGVRKELTGFTDHSLVSDYAIDPMSWCVGNGIILGMTETTLVPTGGATRAQSLVMLYRVINYLNSLAE